MKLKSLTGKALAAAVGASQDIVLSPILQATLERAQLRQGERVAARFSLRGPRDVAGWSMVASGETRARCPRWAARSEWRAGLGEEVHPGPESAYDSVEIPPNLTRTGFGIFRMYPLRPTSQPYIGETAPWGCAPTGIHAIELRRDASLSGPTCGIGR
jgi:hypothetical protein